MSEADKMLHGIGYMKEYEDSSVEIWNYEERFCIRFNKVCKSVDFKRKGRRQLLGLKYHRISIDMQELQAINMKVEELRMDIAETKRNIEYWENEVQQALKENDIMKAVGCRILANNLRKDIGESEI